ncbi:MAG TPA: DUF4349 domain-containing protein [Mucilaginibacter sp.]|nr:DUF4349 domain-containing protein [Mucilaginibacter sp.]
MKTRHLIPLMAGLGLLIACSHSKPGEFASNADTSAVFQNAVNDTAQKLFKTSDMQFKVKNVQQSAEKIATITKNFHGMIMHQRIISSNNGIRDIGGDADSLLRITSLSIRGEMTVKVPAEKLFEFMNEIARLSIVTDSRSTDISDQSLSYLSATMKLKNRTDLIKQQKNGKVIIKNPTDVLLLKDDMVDQQIGNRLIDDEVKNSIVSLSFYQNNTIHREIVVNDDINNYRQPFFKRLGISIRESFVLFGDAIVSLAKVWIFIAVAAGLWVAYRHLRFKKTAALKN